MQSLHAYAKEQILSTMSWRKVNLKYILNTGTLWSGSYFVLFNNLIEWVYKYDLTLIMINNPRKLTFSCHEKVIAGFVCASIYILMLKPE